MNNLDFETFNPHQKGKRGGRNTEWPVFPIPLFLCNMEHEFLEYAPAPVINERHIWVDPYTLNFLPLMLAKMLEQRKRNEIFGIN